MADLRCGTFRRRKSIAGAFRSLEDFYWEIYRSLGNVPAAYIAVPEFSWSGLGHPEIALHFHFLIAGPEQHKKALLRIVRASWRRFGNGKFQAYKGPSGAHYEMKLSGGEHFEYVARNLDRLSYAGPQDFYHHFQSDDYVPNHVRQTTTGETLVIRPFKR